MLTISVKPSSSRSCGSARIAMLSREFIRNKPDLVKRAAEIRKDRAPIDEIVALDAEQRRYKAESDSLKAESNRLSKSFSDRSLGDEERVQLREHARALRDRIAQLDEAI